MTDDHKDRILADCLEAYHRQRARGEVPDMEALQAELPEDLHEDFLELVAAETAIDEALEPAGDAALPLAWGKYTILREIARGAAGVVYEALHRELGRKVALKVLRTGLDTDDVTRERFRREAQALAQIHHDHIVEIYEFGEFDDRPFYAMSLVEGPTLSDLVKRDERPEPREVCEGLAGVANALHALHEAGMVHRDVKPSNIMIDMNTGRYMLADFGLARTAMSATVTRTGDALGTPLYMSPEQMLGNRDAIEARTDVYGLGATLYQMLTGKPPFKTDNLHALMRMVLSQRPEPARTLNPDLPAGCSSIAMKCLEKEARDRYASAADMENDLRAFAEGKRVSGKPLTPWQRSVRQVVKHPVLAVAATLLVAFAVWFAAKPPAPGRLSVTTTQTADIRVGGAGAWLQAPMRNQEVEPGRKHLVTVKPKSDAYLERTFEVKIASGSTLEKEIWLQPRDPNNVAAYGSLQADTGVDAVEDLSGMPGVHRGFGDEAPIVELWFPRGKVRMEDLGRWEAHISLDFPEDGGEIRFSAGAEQLGTMDFPEPETQLTAGDMSDEIRGKLQVGMIVTWQFHDKRGKAVGRPATFEITDVDLRERFEGIEAKFEGWTEEGRSIFGATLRAELMINHGLYGPAFLALRPFVKKESATQRMILLQKKALESLFSDRKERRELKDRWQLWIEVDEAYRAYTKEEWTSYLEKLGTR